ncbi:MAG: STAS domain-containing protein [Nitrospira sp.]|nr:STAS domain-containing protein [Nitrospira sp.]
MDIKSEVYPEAVVLHLQGRFDFKAINTFATALAQAEKIHSPRRIILNLHTLTFIDSMAIGRLVGTWHKLKQDNIRLILAGQTGYINTTLTDIQLEKILPTVETVEEALTL